MIKKLMVLFVLTLVVGSLIPGIADAQRNHGVDNMRGRWDIQVVVDSEPAWSVMLFINDLVPDPLGTPDTYVGTGCLVSPGDNPVQGGVVTPATLQALDNGDGTWDVVFLGTVVLEWHTFVARLTGTVDSNGPSIVDDEAYGDFYADWGQGTWIGDHHDRRRTNCPPVEPQPNLYFHGDVYVHYTFGGGGMSSFMVLEAYTNIVSGSMLVEAPNGVTYWVAPFTDIFSPHVDFISQFRYVFGASGDPISGGTYTFTLLDTLGNPIPGAIGMDAWTGCEHGAPGNFNAVVEANNDVTLSWDPVASTPGFDTPSGIGFYQIEVHGLYGANGVQSSTHLLPWNDFGGHAAGVPDGWDNGIGLGSLDNGFYQLEVVAFAYPNPANPGHGLECAIRDSSENLYFNKTDTDITFVTP